MGDDPSSCSHISMRIYHMASLASLALVLCLSRVSQAAAGNGNDLLAMNKRSAMVFDRLMYNLKEYIKKLPKDDSSGSVADNVDAGMSSRFDRRAYRYVRGKVYTKCYMNAVSCF